MGKIVVMLFLLYIYKFAFYHDLFFNFYFQYPDEIPKIKIRNPRGLSDDELNRSVTYLSYIYLI